MELIAFTIQSISITLLGTLVILLLVYLVSNAEAPNNEPPGPRPIPVLGNLLQLDFTKPYHTLIQVRIQHFSLKDEMFTCNITCLH